MIGDGYRNALLIGLLVLVFPLSARAEQAGDEALLDPVVAEVVEMLEAGVDEEIIDRWLAATDRRPSDIGAEGLIALTEAGASKELMGRILDLVTDSFKSSIV